MLRKNFKELFLKNKAIRAKKANLQQIKAKIYAKKIRVLLKIRKSLLKKSKNFKKICVLLTKKNLKTRKKAKNIVLKIILQVVIFIIIIITLNMLTIFKNFNLATKPLPLHQYSHTLILHTNKFHNYKKNVSFTKTEMQAFLQKDDIKGPYVLCEIKPTYRALIESKVTGTKLNEELIKQIKLDCYIENRPFSKINLNRELALKKEYLQYAQMLHKMYIFHPIIIKKNLYVDQNSQKYFEILGNLTSTLQIQKPHQLFVINSGQSIVYQKNNLIMPKKVFNHIVYQQCDFQLSQEFLDIIKNNPRKTFLELIPNS